MTVLGNVLVRLPFFLATLLSASWAVSFLVSTDHSVELDAIANRIMSGGAFLLEPSPNLLELVAKAEKRPLCNALEARATAIIRLRQFEDAVASSDTILADQQLSSLQASVDLALRCVPTEGFLWFIRYWSAINRGGSVSDHFDELRMSYQLSPLEGWIVLRRSPYVLAIYNALPVDIKEKARKEFSAIVASGFITEAAAILKGPAWAFRDELLPDLSYVPLDLRISLKKRMNSDGLSIEMPGVETPEFRPWRTN